MAGMVKFLIFVLLVVLLPGSAVSDLIVLKDGSQVKAQTVWEENALIHFTLPGYDGIVITYAKEIVLRIEKEKAVTQEATPDSRPQPPETEGAEAEKALSVAKPEKKTITSGSAGTGVEPASSLDMVGEKTGEPPGVGGELHSAPVVTASSITAGQKPVANDKFAESRIAQGEEVSPDTVDEEAVNRVAGIQFYDPRRPYKYQTDTTTRFHTLKEAVDDLAAKFDKSPRWIELNLGDTNDLGQIYRNLTRPVENDQIETKNERTMPGLLFYDPRRAEKYWVSDDSRHRTLEEAVDTLAKQYAQTPDWVIAHLGETNDLVEIHRNLARSAAIETGPTSAGNSPK